MDEINNWLDILSAMFFDEGLPVAGVALRPSSWTLVAIKWRSNGVLYVSFVGNNVLDFLLSVKQMFILEQT